MKNMKNFLPLDELKKVQQYSKDNNVVVVYCFSKTIK